MRKCGPDARKDRQIRLGVTACVPAGTPWGCPERKNKLWERRVTSHLTPSSSLDSGPLVFCPAHSCHHQSSSPLHSVSLVLRMWQQPRDSGQTRTVHSKLTSDGECRGDSGTTAGGDGAVIEDPGGAGSSRDETPKGSEPSGCKAQGDRRSLRHQQH